MKMEQTIRNEASTVPHPIAAAAFFDILPKPNPLMINPNSGRKGISQAKEFMEAADGLITG